ncbi:hypothetical protein MJO29_001038 [Puccinia striiformis f. sp. tritici]|nr:hypothetical protein MJO29_001038 [Puccinia striiformis f. sp. tritici]
MDVCDCSACIRHQYLDNNHQRQPGRYLSARNVLKHRMADIQRGLPTIHIARQHRSLALDSSSSENSSSSGNSSTSSSESEASYIIDQPNPLPLFLILFVSWLHLSCNVSRENCKIAIQMIINILHVILNRRDSLENLGYIPRDPRTMIKRAQLDIELTKLSAAEYPCHEELFINRKLYLGYKDVGEHDYHSKPPVIPPQVIGTPRCTLLSQSILTWVRWLLSKADTEDAVDDWNRTNQDLQDQGYTSDIQHAGRFVQVKLLCVYGDILATKKVVGYASHSATKFCSFCHAKQCDIHLLQLAKRRKKDKTISAAKDSKKADSVSAQEKILANTGVRWSELNRLTYWDPSRHVVLGVMHNWLEGILQGHFCYRWKFWAVSSDEAKKKQKGTYYDKPNKRRKTKGASSMDIDKDEGGIFSGSDDDDDDIFEDILLNGGLQGGFFSQDDIKRFRAGMKHVVSPPGVPHLPHNLGEPKHGKLSASQWHALFVFIIPIVLLDICTLTMLEKSISSQIYTSF